jgi:hypothetical protein
MRAEQQCCRGRQRELFNRALSDQAPPPEEEEFDLLPLPPVASETDSMSVPELIVGAFLECIVGGMSFPEAAHTILGPRSEPPQTRPPCLN